MYVIDVTWIRYLLYLLNATQSLNDKVNLTKYSFIIMMFVVGFKFSYPFVWLVSHSSDILFVLHASISEGHSLFLPAVFLFIRCFILICVLR